MYGAVQVPGDLERTAFRKAEKKYKLYKTTSKKSRQKAAETDLSEIYDFKLILESFNRSGETPTGIFKFECDFCRPVFCFEDRPGFYFIPGALSTEEQCHWVKESLTRFPQPPNRTNHNAVYGPISDLFTAVQNGKILVEMRNPHEDKGPLPTSSNTDTPRWVFKEKFDLSEGDKCNLIAASVLLHKLRWSTLGLQFDWSKRNYDVCLPHNNIPDTLCQLAKELARLAMSEGMQFQPEAAIVNYFSSGDMLGGHLDDMEDDWSKPIVSISLGCKAVFLLGGKSREDSPAAMFLRSGDVVLMAGQARECFHGKSMTCLVGFASPTKIKSRNVIPIGYSYLVLM